MKYLISLIGLIGLFAATPATAQFAASDWVLAQWRGGAYYYPATVIRTDTASVTLEYDDGARETRPVNQVKRYDWKLGSKIECRWTDGGWYGAAITAIGGDGVSLDIVYDDGAVQRTKTKRCRSL
jgi:DNA repair protein Crb2 Tudor domain